MNWRITFAAVFFAGVVLLPQVLSYPCENVEKRLADERLEALASNTSDASLLLGLGCLTEDDRALREKLFDRAKSLDPELGPVTVVWQALMNGADAPSVSALIREDPDNALGYYLRGQLDYHNDREAEALVAFRKGTACEALRLYQAEVHDALFHTVDTLGFEGRDRLCALTGVASLLNSAEIAHLQHFPICLGAMASDEGLERKEEIADLLVIVAGHLWVLNDHGQTYAWNCLSRSFRLKAEAAAIQGSPTMNGYAAVTQALVSVGLYGDYAVGRHWNPELIRFFPSRISRALQLTSAAAPSSGPLFEPNLPENGWPAFEKAKENYFRAARELVEAALEAPDAILGAYLTGLPETADYAQGPWVHKRTPVDRLVQERPQLFEIASNFERAEQALQEAIKEDPRHVNMRRMMDVALQAVIYASEHDNKYPESLDLLYEQGSLKPADAQSVFTGEPYVYLAAGKERQKRAGEMLLLYDSHELEGGVYQAVYGDGHGQGLSKERFERQLRQATDN